MISGTEEELKSFLNQKLSEIASVLLAYYDCCHIRGSSCKAGDPNPCCLNSQFGPGVCMFWQHGKCQYENCDCKLWLCETAIASTDTTCVKALRMLEDFAGLFGLVRPPFIGDGYVGADKQPC